MEQLTILSEQIEEQSNLIKKLLLQYDSTIFLKREWIPRIEVMKYMGYADTQMTAIARQYKFTTSYIGKRIFYKTSSILAALDRHKQ